MKRINGECFQRVKFADGKKYLIRMSEDEVAERELYWIVVAVLPLLAGALMAWVYFSGVSL